MPNVPVGQPTETDQAQAIHPLTRGVAGQVPAVYGVYPAEEKSEARPIFPKGQGTATKAVGQALETDAALQVVPMGSGTATVGLGVAETTETALPVTPKGQGTATKAVGQAIEVNAAQAVTPRQVPTRRITAKATALPQAVKAAEVVAYAGRDATGVVLQLQVVDGNGAAVDLAWATTVVLVFRNELARWEVTPSKVTAAGYLEAEIPDQAFRRVDTVDYQVRADFPDGGSRWTRPGRIALVARL